MSSPSISTSNLFIFARDQAFFNFFFGDRGSDLAIVKSYEILRSTEVQLNQKAYPGTEVPLGRKVPSSAVPAGQAESNGKPKGRFTLKTANRLSEHMFKTCPLRLTQMTTSLI